MQSIAVLVSLAATLAGAHLLPTYPGSRGNTLHTNGTVGVDDYSNSSFPYGMQWEYPCGGLPMSSNRTYWPIGGGAVAWQMGWFPGHSQAFQYINLGINQANNQPPLNYSHVMQPMFAINGPTNGAYPQLGVCLPFVSTPAGLNFKEGDNATIQIIEAAQHGAALFSCIDITFTNDMSKVQRVDENNCKNDSTISFNQVFQVPLATNAGSRVGSSVAVGGLAVIAAALALF